jgi:Large polyvalent protein associated domain 38/ADP-Ribosyltransferase in polyvalent proteins
MSLPSCLNKAAKALQRDDSLAIQKAFSAYRQQGLSERDAGVKAIQDMIDTIGEAKISPKVLAALNAIARAFGKRIELYNDRSEDGYVDPAKSREVIYLNENTQVNGTQVFFHELFHLLILDNPKAFAAIAKVINPNLTPEKIQRFREYYADPDKAEAGLIEEIQADLFAEVATADESFWGEVFAEVDRMVGPKAAPGVVARLGAALNKVARLALKALNAPGFTTSEIVGEIEGLRDAYKTALATYIAERRTGAPVESAAPVEGEIKSPVRPTNAAKDDLRRSLGDERISPRMPTAVKATEDPLAETRLQPDLTTAQRDAEVFRHNIGLMSQYPNFQGIGGDTNQMAEAMIAQMKDNLLWLYNHWRPELRERSRMWYVGGNRISHRWADRFNTPPWKVAAVIAATSPQKDWFQNVSLAERILEGVVYNADVPWSQQMTDTVNARDWGGSASRDLGYTPRNELARLQGKTLRDLFDPNNDASLLDMAVWIRAWDETNNPRKARVISPEGAFIDEFDATKDGRPIGLRWQSFATIAKTLKILTATDRAQVSEIVGANHKVRSFFNNIISPYDDEDVTIDTHAVAAAQLRPLGSSATEVAHNFGTNEKGMPGPKNSAVTGLFGTYPIYAEAYRRAAKEVGVLPREMQSITWEAVRGLFRPEQKNERIKGEANRIWTAVSQGEMNVDEAREQISRLVNGIQDPAWVRSPAGSNEAARDSSYEGGVSESGVPGGGAEPAAAGSRSRPAAKPARLKSTQRQPFYSALAKGVEGIGTKAAPAAGWKDAIKGLVNKGVAKADEVEWSGVNDWLDLQEGKVTKQAVSDYLKEGGVRVEETVLGEQVYAAETEEAYDNLRREIADWPEPFEIDGKEYLGDRDQDEILSGLMDYEFQPGALPRGLQEPARRWVKSLEAENNDPAPTQYSTYTLPGGENYREVLLRLPTKVRFKKLSEEELSRFALLKSRALSGLLSESDRAEYESLDERNTAEDTGALIDPAYRSQHWDQPNVIAHIRVNDRTDADGKKVLFVEEIQSDWGQEGKKKGFKGPPLTKAERERYAILTAQIDDPSGMAEDLTPAERAEFGDLSRRTNQAIGVPNAPFVTKTESWLNLSLKRVITMAVEGGYDSVAFVTGEQSAARYDLSKQIKSVAYFTPDGKAADKFGTVLKAFDHKDREVINKSVPPENLPDYIGKDVAEKLLAQPRGKMGEVTLSGLDLKVGGEGMKTFYDTIVPTALKKLLPKVGGGQMGSVTFRKSRGFEDSYAQNNGMAVAPISQPGFDVTPEMREKAADGLPLFSTQRNTEAFKQWFGDSKVVDADGNPLVVYHNTSKDFAVFEPSDLGIHLGTTIEQAEDRAKVHGSEGNKTMPLYASIKNPLRLSDSPSWVDPIWSVERTGLENYLSPELIQEAKALKQKYKANRLAEGFRHDGSANRANREDAMGVNRKIVKELEAQGYDGIVYANTHDGATLATRMLENDSYIAFHPEQIKSAIGNNGDFDPTNPDITRSTQRKLVAALANLGVTPELVDLYADMRAKVDFVEADREFSSKAEKAAATRARTKFFAAAEAAGNAAIIQSAIARIVDMSGVGAAFDSPDITRSTQRIVGQSSRTYDADQKAFFENVGRTITVPTLKERYEAIRKDIGKKLAQGIADQFAPIKELSSKAYALARLSKGSAGAVEAFLNHGKLSIRDGAYDADQSGGFVQTVGAPLQGELEDFLWWVAANRAEKLTAEDRENLFTQDDIDAGKTLADGTTKFDYTLANGQTTRDRRQIYEDSLKKFDAFNKNAMDMAEQSGLIDGASRQYWENEFYVPFYRQSDEEGFVGARIGQALVRQRAFKELKGGTEKLNSDLLANVLQNWAHLIDAAAKNRAAVETLEAAAQMGAAHYVPAGTKKSVWVMQNGEQQHYLVEDPYLVAAIQSLEFSGLKGPLMDAMSKFKQALTIGVTASPVFKINNLIRDSIQAIGTSPLSYNPITNVREGLKASDRSSQTYVSALASGALIRFGTMTEGRGSDRVRQLVRAGVKDTTILDSDNKYQAFYERYMAPAINAYNELGNRGEEINRAALFKQLKDGGMDHAQASLLARDLMDFSMQGSWTTVRFLSQVVPFLNARIQGLYKLGRAANEDRQRFQTVVGAVALASVSLMLAYSDDEDWKKREDWDRDNFWWFKIADVAFRIPKPFEIGAIGTLAERGVEYFASPEMTGARFMERFRHLLTDNLAMNPVPQMVKPILDLYSNKDGFTGRPIETLGMERLQAEYRFTANTSMLARAASTASMGAMSPVQIDHAIRGYFGWLGTFVVSATDTLVRPLTDEPTRPAADLVKVASGGLVRSLPEPQSRYVSQMYDQAKVLEQAYGTYHALLKQGKTEEAREFLDSNREEIGRYKRVEGVKAAEAKFNEMIRMIERSAMDPEVKRERIQQIQAQKDRVARGVAQ